MKKILFIISFIFISSNVYAGTCTEWYISKKMYNSWSTCAEVQGGENCVDIGGYYYFVSAKYAVVNCEGSGDIFPEGYSPQGDSMCTINPAQYPETPSVTCLVNPSNGNYGTDGNLSCNDGYSSVNNDSCWSNPDNGAYDDLGNLSCNDGYYFTGSSTSGNQCMNTPYIPENDDGSCPSGWTTTTNMTTGQTTCLPPNYSNPDSGGDSGSGSTGGDSGSGSTGGDTGSGSTGGTTVQNPDGSSTTTYPDGSSTTNYPDGTSTSSGSTGGTSGGSGTGGAGTGASTPSENNPTPETPYNPDPVANSCNDTNLTLQEKMLCELNQGMKNQNAESDPSNSLNNLLKDINSDNNKTGEAINKNIKSTNDNLDTVNKNLVQSNKNTEAMVSKQNAMVAKQESSNQFLQNIDTNISNGLKDSEGKGFLDSILESLTTFTTPLSSEDKSSYSSQIDTQVTSTLNSSFSKYSNVLGLGSSYGTAPSNVEFSLMGQTYTLLDYSVLAPYIDLIRALLISGAYIIGFLYFLRGSK
jgi:hypothetical protein